MAGGLVERLCSLLWPELLPDLGRWRLDPRRSWPWRRVAGQRAAGGAGAAGAGVAPDCRLQIADCSKIRKWKLGTGDDEQFDLPIPNPVVVPGWRHTDRAAAGQPDTAKPAFVSRRAGCAAVC